MPGNVTVRWFREGSPVREVAALETRVTIRKDGTLIINPVSADDSGTYTCEVSNGIGDAQSAGAYLNVECKYEALQPPVCEKINFISHISHRRGFKRMQKMLWLKISPPDV